MKLTPAAKKMLAHLQATGSLPTRPALGPLMQLIEAGHVTDATPNNWKRQS